MNALTPRNVRDCSPLPGGRVRVIVQLTDDLLAALDKRADELHASRSEVIRIAIAAFLAREPTADAVKEAA